MARSPFSAHFRPSHYKPSQTDAPEGCMRGITDPLIYGSHKLVTPILSTVPLSEALWVSRTSLATLYHPAATSQLGLRVQCSAWDPKEGGTCSEPRVVIFSMGNVNVFIGPYIWRTRFLPQPRASPSLFREFVHSWIFLNRLRKRAIRKIREWTVYSWIFVDWPSTHEYSLMHYTSSTNIRKWVALMR
jgi:hypothetical protein